MFVKRFRFQVVFRTLLLTGTLYAFLHMMLLTRLYATIVIVGAAALYQVVSLIRYVEKTNRNLSRFLTAVKHGDAISSFPGKELGSSFTELIALFDEVMEKIRRTRSEKEEHYRYLHTVFHHVGIGLLTFRPDGEVDLINTAAKRMLKVPRLKNIKSLEGFSPYLVERLFSIKAGEKALVKIDDFEMELAIYAAEFRLKDRAFTLVSLQDIRSELQEKEMEAWQTLIRVLTHEIMNSMTPITSMTSTILGLLDPIRLRAEENVEAVMDAETAADVSAALQTIQKRSEGLTHFVAAYRNLTLIPRPRFKIFPVDELFARVEKLMEHKLKERKIAYHWSVEPQTLELTADPGLIEQVMINLLLNAVDAMQDQKEPALEWSAVQDEIGRVMIRIKDNGPGIVKEALGKVFIPFFTTKKTGSGIGLSLSRQIMKQHKGTMSVQSIPDQETIFTLKF